MVSADQLIPRGILDTDHWHEATYDETCSRCRQPIPDDHVPLQLYRGNDMLSYCEDCCGVDAEQRAMRQFEWLEDD